jgi:hypothetical protein
MLIFQLFAVAILHCPLQSVTITQIARPPEIFTGFLAFFHLEISQPAIQECLCVFRPELKALIEICLGFLILIQGVIGIAAIVKGFGILRFHPDGLTEIVDGLLMTL